MAKTAPTRGQASRDRLERSALRCFVTRGIDATTTKAIARGAKMAEGNLYRHYAGKEELAWALYEKHLRGFVLALAETAKVKGSSRERLAALVHRFRLLFEQETEIYTYIVLAQHHLIRRSPKGMRTPTDIVAEVLAEGQKRGEVKAGSPLLLAVLIVGMVIRVTLLKLRGWLEEDLDALERETVEACWRVVAKHKEGGA
jgi:AcrR family transcriptional regulator